MLKERLNYLFMLSIENVTIKSLSFEEAIKDYTAKKRRGKSIIEVCQKAINKNTLLFFWILWCLLNLSAFFFKFAIPCDFFYPSKYILTSVPKFVFVILYSFS